MPERTMQQVLNDHYLRVLWHTLKKHVPVDDFRPVARAFQMLADSLARSGTLNDVEAKWVAEFAEKVAGVL